MVLFSNKRSMNARFRDLCKNISILKYRTFLTMYQVDSADCYLHRSEEPRRRYRGYDWSEEQHIAPGVHQ